MAIQEFIYVLKLVPRLHKESGWTEEDNKTVQAHVQALKKRKAEGSLILAGRTQIEEKDTFGIVVLAVESEKNARQMMNSDPAVRGGIMTAELFPFKTAFISQANSPDAAG